MKESKEKGFAMKRKDGLIYLCFREVAFVLIEFLMMKREKNGQTQSAPCLASSFFLRLFDCFPVPANFRIPCSIFFFRRMKSCKKDVSFRRQQSRAGRCQSPDLTSSFFLRLLNCSIVRLFGCSIVSLFLLPSLFLVFLFFLPGGKQEFSP